MKFLTRGRVRLALLGVVVLGLAAGGIAYASIPGSNGVIHGCYQKINGQLRVIDPGAGGTCTTSENPLDWNQFSGYEVVNTAVEETATTSAFAIFEESASCPTGKVALSGGVLATVFDAAGDRPATAPDGTVLTTNAMTIDIVAIGVTAAGDGLMSPIQTITIANP